MSNLLGIVSEFCDVKQLALLFGIELFAEGVGVLCATSLFSKFIFCSIKISFVLKKKLGCKISYNGIIVSAHKEGILNGSVNL